MKGRTAFVFSICIVIFIASTEVKLCNVDEFECSNSNCIDVTRRCDDNFDCDDFSDEENCEMGQMSMRQLPQNQQNRTTTQKVHQPAFNKEHITILTGEGTIFCPEGLYRCDDGECVQTESQCNGIIQCSDGTDATNCAVVPTTSSSLMRDAFTVQLTSLEETSQLTPLEETNSHIQTVDILSSFQLFSSSTMLSSNSMSTLTLPTITHFQSELTQNMSPTMVTNTRLKQSTSVSTIDVPADVSITSSHTYFQSLAVSTLQESATFGSILASMNSITANKTSALSTIRIDSSVNSILYSSIETHASSLIYSSSLLSQPVLPQSKDSHFSALHSSDISFEVIQLSTSFIETHTISSSIPNIFILTTSVKPVYTLFVSSVFESSSVFSSDLSAVMTVSSTPSTSESPKDNKDIVIPAIIVACLVFLVICAAAWKFRGHIRNNNRKGQFGSIISLDMVHPHPDMKGAPGKQIVKTSSYNALTHI